MVQRYPKRKTTSTSEEVGIEHGFRSGLEDRNARVLLDAGVPVVFEAHKIRYSQPEKLRTYTPDFILPNGIVIETKGRFVSADRQKHLYVQKAYPLLDLRFVFSKAYETISKTSKTRYCDWCAHKGFQWANGDIPQAWIDEKPTQQRLKAAYAALGWKPKA